MSDQYDADYFLRGRQSGKSLYEDYRWLPELTRPMAQRIMEHCGIEAGMRVLDFGCARGYLVRALREWGVEAFGYDTSKWATENADPSVREFVCWSAGSEPAWMNQSSKWDWIIAKDVLEHIEYVNTTIDSMLRSAAVGVFAVVPLSPFDRTKYVIPDYERDVTHIQRLTLTTWAKMFVRPVWRVELAYRVPGIKDNYYREGWEYGNGFITARRV